jgi:hypothetical protein
VFLEERAPTGSRAGRVLIPTLVSPVCRRRPVAGRLVFCGRHDLLCGIDSIVVPLRKGKSSVVEPDPEGLLVVVPRGEFARG